MSKKAENRIKNKEGISVKERAVIVPDAAPATPKHKKMSVGAKIAVTVLFLIAIAAIVMMIITLVFNSFMSKINTTEPWEHHEIILAERISDMSVYEDEAFLASDAYAQAQLAIYENYLEASHDLAGCENAHNFAFFGINTYDTKSSGKATMISVTSFNSSTKKVTYLTFEEDVLVYIPVLGKIGRLRDAYEWGGSALLCKTIQHNFGVKIDGFIEINLAAAAKLIDSNGGMTVNHDVNAINQAIDDYNKLFGTEVAQVSGSGDIKLSGEQALAYSRISSGTMEVVLRAVANATFKSGLGGMKDAFNILTSNAKTAIVEEDFAIIVKMALFSLKSSNVESLHLGTSETIYHRNIKVNAYEDYVAVVKAINDKIN